jgi:parvulin-like peptidyl-prolyl isomerase
MRHLRPLIIFVVLAPAVVLPMLLLPACGDPEPPRPSRSPAEVVARVDGAPITSADVRRARDVALFSGTRLDEEQALRQLVGEKLVDREADRLGLTVTDAEVDERLDTVATAAGGMEALEAQLKKAGIGTAELRAAVRSVLVGEKVEASKYADLAATRAEARAYYDENEALFTTPAAVKLGDLAVRREGIARNALARIAAGQPFDNAARQFSVDPELKANSGLLGWVTVGSLPGPARRVVADLAVGELSAPVQVGGLWHVFKLYDRRPARTQPFEQVADVLRRELTRRSRAEALARWVEQERERADIVTGGS